MGKTSTVTIIGNWRSKNRVGTLMQILKTEGGSFEIDGCIQGMLASDDGMEFVSKAVNGECAFGLAEQMLRTNQLSSVDCVFEIEGVDRFFNIDLHYHDRLVIAINANRKTLNDDTTDFSWYYENIISPFLESIIQPESILFCDDL